MSNRFPKSTRLRLESLEARRVLAGTVTAAVVDGNLLIDGDDDDNAFVITSSDVPGEFTISGMNGTTINDLDEVTLGEVTGGIEIDTEGGNDNVYLRGVNLPGSLTIETDEGEDRVTMYRSNIEGNVSIDTGDGADRVRVVSSRFLDGLFIETGEGNDGVSIYGSRRADRRGSLVEGKLEIATGTENDRVRIAGLSIAGDTEIRTGDGNDRVLLGSPRHQLDLAPHRALRAEGDFSIDTSDGADRVRIVDALFGAELKVDLGADNDGLGIRNTRVEGELIVKAGDGDDSVAIHGSTLNSMDVKLEDGNDNFLICGSLVKGASSITAGDGDDTLAGAFTVFEDDLTVDGGEGFDTGIAGFGLVFLGELNLESIEEIVGDPTLCHALGRDVV